MASPIAVLSVPGDWQYRQAAPPPAAAADRRTERAVQAESATGRGPAGRVPLFCDTALARRIERAEAGLIAASSRAAQQRRRGAAGFVIPLAGGIASYAEADSPFNKVAGLGFGGVPSADELAAVEQAFAARGAAVQVELAHLADPAIGAVLTARGYRLESFENVLGRSLGRPPDPVTPPGIEVRLSPAEEIGPWLDVVTDAVAHPDTGGVPAHEEFPREAVARAELDMVAAGAVRYSALCDGALAGGGSMRVAGSIAQLTGAATAPARRRRGIQSALLSARLAAAAAAGCEVAVVTTQPGSRSQQNVQRRGFDLLYTRAILIRQP
jgi:GNAT superfamily N-acetyltransferase